MSASPLPSLQSPPSADLTLLRSLPVQFEQALKGAGLPPLAATGIDVLQLNLGKLCNQTCAHCHVDAGPTRTEVMSEETAELCLRVLESCTIPTVDLTGGAPELCPSFERIVKGARRLGRKVIDRCNLTVLSLPRFEHLPTFFAEQGVEVVCSLPHHRELATDRQRGSGVHAQSIDGLRKLNRVGFGQPASGLELVLVTNPVGAFLPSQQASLEQEWKLALERDHGVQFNRLISITNMPVRRYLDWLQRSGNLEAYMQRLSEAFNPAAADGVMCRSSLSVDWQGNLYDCDFNQMLELPIQGGAPRHLRDFDMDSLAKRTIVTNNHCFGCTAGAGSSCGGAIA
ncbi:MAG: radical SAM/Cys-rich protein [Candidatus Paceibacteria bacterium]|jgi:radical SAM/Cys-rich protein